MKEETMKKKICKFISIALILLSCLTVKVNAEENPNQFLDESIFNHLTVTEQYHSESIYSVGEPIDIIKCDNSADNLSIETPNYGLIYPVFENSKLILLAYHVGDTIKITDVINNSFIDAVEKGHAVSAIDINGLLYFCYDNTVVCVNGETEATERISAFANTLEINRDDTKRELSFSNRSIMSNTINLPTRGQSPYYMGCWAACIASFDSYYNSHNTTVSNVVYAVTGSYNQVLGKTVSQVISYLSTYYSISTSQRSVNSTFCSSARSDIDAGKAYILEWQQTIFDSLTGNYSVGYHYTCLKGYAYSYSSYSYYIMDPYYNSSMSGGTYTLSTTSSTSFPNNTSMYGGGTCTLYDTLHKN